ncbi:hypothetical protein [Natronococcus wangiae]|uniref:hypothetical protein n=1 Tax=Natronococcus wangiae TaxID=3068275 RepID=UPI00273F8A55|nr:hypothetical protein [Natronococcus sp. AD5]
MNTVSLLLLPIAAPLAATWWMYSDASREEERQPVFWIATVGISFIGGFLAADLNHSIFAIEYALNGHLSGLDDPVVLTSMTVNTLSELISGTATFILYLYWEKRGIFS